MLDFTFSIVHPWPKKSLINLSDLVQFVIQRRVVSSRPAPQIVTLQVRKRRRCQRGKLSHTLSPTDLVQGIDSWYGGQRLHIPLFLLLEDLSSNIAEVKPAFMSSHIYIHTYFISLWHYVGIRCKHIQSVSKISSQPQCSYHIQESYHECRNSFQYKIHIQRFLVTPTMFSMGFCLFVFQNQNLVQDHA